MAYRESFALQHSDLDAFLFAEVGTERSGMALTVVSVIARLGEDPWAEAKRLSTLPTLAAIDYLARAIARMPTSSWALTDSIAIATRLVPLLPAQPRISRRTSLWQSSGSSVLPSARMLLLYGTFGAWLAINMIAFHGRSAADNRPIEQVGIRQPQASETRSLAPWAKAPMVSLKRVPVEAADRR